MTIFKSLIIILSISFAANADSDMYYATLVKNIKMNSSGIQDNVIDDDNAGVIKDDVQSSEIPKCEEIGEVGDLDCMDRLYVSDKSLRELVSGSPVVSNSGSVFSDYGWESINTYHVKSTVGLFRDRDVNYNIEKWDMSNVTSSIAMFESSNIDQNLNNWNVGNIVNMKAMFLGSTFNGSLSNWNVSNVTDMSGMFSRNSSFNQPLNSWNVENVKNMDKMFEDAISFEQDISMWNVCSVEFRIFENKPHYFVKSDFPEEYLPDFGNDDLCN